MSNSFIKSPQHSSHIADDQKLDVICAITSHDVFSSEEISATSKEVNPHNRNSAIDEPAERVSILDQLKQCPLATITTSRKKRLVDAPPQSFIAQKRLTSLQKSRSSSTGDTAEVKESDVLCNESDSAGDNATTDGVQEESMINKSAENMPCTSGFHDVAMPVTTGLPKNGSREDTASDIAALRDEANNLNEEAVLDSGIIEVTENGCLKNEVRQNGQLDLPMKTVIFKKKRKPNRKRASNSIECARLDKHTELQVDPSRSLSESPNSRGEITETDHKADGDKHLPLVKRARVRMGKPLAEEKQFDDLLGTNEKSEVSVTINNCDKCSTCSSPGNNCLPNGTSLGVKEDSNSSPINDCSLPSGRDLMLWKSKRFPLKGFQLDVEAALPPSKRLHRALEAMSANSAGATDDCPKAPRPMEMMPNGCMVSPKTNSLRLSTYGNTENPTRLHDTHYSECNALNVSASGMHSQNLDVPTIASSEVKTDDINSEDLRDPHDKHCNEILVDVKNCDGSSMSKIVDADIHFKSMQPCSFRLTEKQVNPSNWEGMPHQLSSLRKINEKEILQPEEKCLHSPMGNISGDRTAEPTIQKPTSVLSTKWGSDSFSPVEAFMIMSTTNGSSTTSGTSKLTKSSRIKSDEDAQTRDMEDVAREVRYRVTSRDQCISPDLTPMKYLIAAAQAKRFLSQSTSFSDNSIDYKVEAVISPSFVYKEDSLGKGSPSNPMINHTSAMDDRRQLLRNSSRSPRGGLRQKSLSKLTDLAEANAARKSFEALLCTLTRTKESIGRATRLAIECAKYGIAGEVVDILLQTLERESSLYRRVDLFFLVDSITQCSRSQKGGAGDVYPSLVQSVLPRLLSAAAPPGNAARENRRQCLKVLRLWLERKTLPESIIRLHIRELESVNEASFTCASSRRPSRNERALNDPVREMEGMLVDEYGSNTSFQLPCLLRTTLLEDEEANASDEKGFEAVTPERHAVVDHEKGIAEKHRRILEDVDGELEMEDVAPLCEVEVRSSSHVSGDDTICSMHNQPDQHHSLPFAPPLPEERPPTPPPLPSSPPPLPPPCSSVRTVVSQHQPGSHAVADTADLHLSSITHSMQNQQSESFGQHPSTLNANSMPSELVPCYMPRYGGPPKQMPPPVSSHNSSTSYGSLPVSHPANSSGTNFQSMVTAPMCNKAYRLKPPPPTVSNQFSYVHAEPQHQPWGNCSTFTERFHYVHDVHGGNFYGDGSASGPVQQKIVERGRFYPAFRSGPSVSDQVEASPVSVSHYGPPSDPPPISCPGWLPHPRVSGYSVSASRPSIENRVSRAAGAPGYWRPR
ncbi:protein HUA2-LIKE 2 [Cocos nucifera]|uniref:Protein HUA2-LIKE 2 n=1 Tax=Cocos nucifera TaxID=13894 RepID=A0A8K0IZL1_COCNU|nr:protein HUA2-LIKE 2 [Cocos nucifera]